MKAIRLLGTGFLVLALGIAGPLYAGRQEDKKQQDDKNRQQPPPKQQEPPKQQQQSRPQQQAPPKQQEQQRQQQSPQQQRTQQQQSRPQEQPKQQSRQQQPTSTVRSTRQPQQAYGGAYHGGVTATAPTNGGVHPSGVPQHSGQVRSGFSQSKAGNWSNDHKTWQQRGGYNGYRIPDTRFSLYFGREHHFRISGLPILFVGGFPRFQYDGYWITFVDPWPDNWPPDWYETDDIYLDYTDDGYYLYDANYPGIGIAVTVSN
jgi:hypothetical protein